MKVQSYTSGGDERRVVIGMITDPVVLGRIETRWTGKEFASRWSNIVGGWCVEHWRRHQEAPGKLIESRFERWREKAKDEATVKLVDRFLSGINGEYEEQTKDQNSDYLIDLAGSHFNRVRVAKLKEQLDRDLEDGDPGKSIERIASFSQMDLGVGSAVDVLEDAGAVMAAFSEGQDALVTYPGDLGRFYGEVFCREAFVTWMGPEKRGKSFALMDFVVRSVTQRRKTAYFEVGDMGQRLTIRRLAGRIAKQPIRARDLTVDWPVKLFREDGDVKCDREPREFDDVLSWRNAVKAMDKLKRMKTKTNVPLLKLSSHPNSSIAVGGIESQLEVWERDGWIADCVVIDYADILAPPPGKRDERDQINSSWQQLRALAQRRHCCVVTATQADAASYDKDLIRPKNFSGDKRKLAHVTAMIGLNQTETEKKQGTMRLNFVVLREGDFSVSRCVHVAQCLPLGNPAVKSLM